MSEINALGTTVYKGRWGYHSTDFVTYRKLKTLYKVYWRCLRLRAARKRWDRKFPKNRKGAEPIFCTLHKMIIESNVFQDFNNARKPVENPDCVLPCKMTLAEIDDLLVRWAMFQEKSSQEKAA